MVWLLLLCGPCEFEEASVSLLLETKDLDRTQSESKASCKREAFICVL